jgi:hypothetical protein
MSDMQPITCWWKGLPGIDGDCLTGDLTLDDRAAALQIAARLYGDLPPSKAFAAKKAEEFADRAFSWFQAAESDQLAWYSRLAVAMVVSTIGATEKPDVEDIRRRANWIVSYLTRKPRNVAKRGRGLPAATG